MEGVGFKKKAKKTAGARKRTREAEPEALDQVEDTLQTIEEILEDQRLRAQMLRAEQLSGKKHAKKADGATAAAIDVQYGLHDPKKDGSAGAKLLNLLDGQFTGQTGSTQKDQHEELVNKYIEERLQKKATSDDDPSAAPPAISAEDALYEDLRKEASSFVPEHDSADGGVLIWNTGIAEVELPSAFQERTVEATKRALELQQASARARRDVESSALPTNFSTDFNRHRSDHVAELKALSKGEQRERGFVAVKNHKSSDDHAVSRFRKMESRRRHK